MAQYKVQTPEGKVLTLEGPDGASHEQVIAMAQHLLPQTQKANPVMSFIRGFNGGALSNFADEATAGLGAVVPKISGPGIDPNASIWDGIKLGDAYKKNLQTIRGEMGRDAQQHPVASTAGDVTGALAQTALTHKVLPTAKAAPIATAAAQGAVQGAAAGAGQGTDAGSRLNGAVNGAETGAAVGGAIGGAMKLAPAAINYFRTVMGKGADEAAMAQLNKALVRQGYDVSTPAGQTAVRSALQTLGPDATLADLGKVTRTRAGVALRTANDAQQQGLDVLNARRAGAPDRLSSDIRATVAPRTDVHALDDALVEQRSQTALPLKQQALAEPNPKVGSQPTPDDVHAYMQRPNVQKWIASGGQGEPPPFYPDNLPVVPDDPALHKLVQTDAARKALSGAKQLATMERQTLEATGADTSHLPDFPEDGSPLDMKSLDYLKRHLDGEVSRAYNSTDSATLATAPALRNLRNAIRDRMRSVGESQPGVGDGPYGQYLDTFSDASDLRDALAAGRGGQGLNGKSYTPPTRMDPEAIAKTQAAHSPAEQEFYKTGYARLLEDQVRGSTSPAGAILKTPLDVDRLAAAGVPAEDVSKLQGAVGREKTYQALNNEASGSATDERIAARQEANDGQISLEDLSRSPQGWLGKLATGAVNKLNTARSSAVNAELIPRILAQGPDATDKVVQELAATGDKLGAEALKRAAAARFAGGASAALIGSPTGGQ